MTNLQILEKAIRKAIDNGWKTELLKKVIEKPPYASVRTPTEILRMFRARGVDAKDSAKAGWQPRACWETLFYSHDFAKALWGEKKYANQLNYETKEELPEYLYKLQQMVIADDPIKYLEENI